jgi:hypothetical protein
MDKENLQDILFENMLLYKDGFLDKKETLHK